MQCAVFQALLRSEARTRLNFSVLSRSANCQGVVQEGHLRVIGQDEIFRLEIRKVVSCLTTTRENFLHILEISKGANAEWEWNAEIFPDCAE